MFLQHIIESFIYIIKYTYFRWYCFFMGKKWLWSIGPFFIETTKWIFYGRETSMY